MIRAGTLLFELFISIFIESNRLDSSKQANKTQINSEGTASLNPPAFISLCVIEDEKKKKTLKKFS